MPNETENTVAGGVTEPNDLPDILTFDEILADPQYKAEFDRRVQQALDIKTSHPDVKGGNNMEDNKTQTQQGETQTPDSAASVPPAQPDAANNPDAASTQETATQTAQEQPAQVTQDADAASAKQNMSAEQFEAYNEALRAISKAVHGSVRERYNAFEDSDIKAAVKARVMSGETLDIRELATSAITKLIPQDEPKPQPGAAPQPANDEVKSLKAELALLKAGIKQDRIDAAKKLFLAEGGDPEKAADFVAKYPEWKQQAQSGEGIAFSQAPPVSGITAPAAGSQAAATDFERKVAAARKARGLD